MTVSLEAPWFQPTCVALLCRPTHSRRRFAQLYIHTPTHAQSRSSHARFDERRARMYGYRALRGARADADNGGEAIPLPCSLSVARSLPPARLAAPRYSQRSAGTAAAPRAHRLDEPSAGTIWAPTATPPLSFSLPFLSRLPTLLWPRRRPQPVASLRRFSPLLRLVSSLRLFRRT